MKINHFDDAELIAEQVKKIQRGINLRGSIKRKVDNQTLAQPLLYFTVLLYFLFGYAAFSSCIWQQVAIFQLYRVINSPINIYLATVMSPFLFYQFSTHFFDIKGYSKESKVHCNLVFSHMPESSVCHVVFHLSKHSLWFYTPPASMLDTFFWEQPFPCLPFVLI